ncbi:hypothetical protein BBD41_19770 [Paenibacillus ihbetae]|uniref:Uncharacterized protein n=1 Tax=Paenibacillus ihbetae TaxID=1870820 RepID=A0A1B2E3Y3_9BACL|nr:hypothetical protein [Paenibacillus ihbetae]ANY74622.1 hypothetical protein BBD41_19770 [Paenibacillus ihbetae]
MRKRKIFTGLLAFSIMFTSFGLVASADTYENDDSVKTVVYKGHGVFVESNNTLNFNKNSEKAYSIYKQNDAIYELHSENNDVTNYLIETANNQYQLVGKKEVDPRNLNSIQQDNRISDYIKDDINKVIENASNDDFSINVYSPALVENLQTFEANSNSVTPYGYLPTVYYTGKGSLKYKDEVLHIQNYSSLTGERKWNSKDQAQAEYKKVFSQLIQVLVGEGLNQFKKVPAVGISYSFVSMFGQDPAIGGDTKDKIKVFVSEVNKYRKYTSVMFPSTDYKLGAISDWVPNYEVHSDKIVSGKITSKTETATYKGENYQWLDQKAYEQKGSLNYWNELITQHEYYGLVFKSAID